MIVAVTVTDDCEAEALDEPLAAPASELLGVAAEYEARLEAVVGATLDDGEELAVAGLLTLPDGVIPPMPGTPGAALEEVLAEDDELVEDELVKDELLELVEVVMLEAELIVTVEE